MLFLEGSRFGLHRRNKKDVVRVLLPFGQQHVDRLRDRMGATSDKRQFFILIFNRYDKRKQTTIGQ